METKMYSFISVFVVSLILISTVSGQQIINQTIQGPCSRFQVGNQTPFFKKFFMGTWFVYVSYDYEDILGLDCLVAFYQLTPDGNAINFERGKNLTSNERKTFTSNFYFNRPGVGHYTFEQGADAESIALPVVDYNQFYIEFSCVDIAGGKVDCYFAAFTRLPIPSAIVVNRINDYINAHNIDRTKLRYISHDKARCIF